MSCGRDKELSLLGHEAGLLRGGSVARRVPSAKADSILSTLLSRHLRAGLSRWRRFAAGARFIPLAVIVTEFRNSFAAAAATGMDPRLTRRVVVSAGLRA